MVGSSNQLYWVLKKLTKNFQGLNDLNDFHNLHYLNDLYELTELGEQCSGNSLPSQYKGKQVQNDIEKGETELF